MIWDAHKISKRAPLAQKPGILRRLLRVFLLCAGLFLFVSLGSVFIYRFFPVYLTPLMIQRSAESVFGEKWVGIDKTWVSLDEISPHMQKAVIKAEDFKFFDHYGFDFAAIEKAMEYNRTHKRMKGASTISQQTAKNVFLWPSRSWIRKGLEAYFTVLIEIFWSKERILEVYLNVIELGHGVYGVEAASQKYFKTSALKLTPAQASRLAAVLPNPIRFKVDRPSGYVLRRQNLIMRRVAPPLPQEEESLLDSLEIDLKFFEPEEEAPEQTRHKKK